MSTGSSLRSGSISDNPAAFNLLELYLLPKLLYNLRVLWFKTLTPASNCLELNLGTGFTGRIESDEVTAIFFFFCLICYTWRVLECPPFLFFVIIVNENVYVTVPSTKVFVQHCLFCTTCPLMWNYSCTILTSALSGEMPHFLRGSNCHFTRSTFNFHFGQVFLQIDLAK